LPDYRKVSDQRTIHKLTTEQLSAQQVTKVRELLWAAFADDEDGAFTEEDWLHSIGGTHFIAEVDGAIVGHASLVERTLHVDGVPTRTGYVEAVATQPQLHGQGHGSALMSEVNALIEHNFELGALGTGSQGFYERLGWQIWQGPSSVITSAGEERTPDEDGYIMVLVVTSTSPIDLQAPIACEWRPGDVW
jgi:aminoglycoside 2'-N-acetyltransferase I